jgi:hypothetical protein
MCFYHEYDWEAEVYENDVGTAEQPTCCQECDEPIPVGGWVRHIHMRELEHCRESHWLHDYAEEPECPPDCEHDFGETDDYDRCEGCDKILRAVKAVEEANGCKGDETQPALSMLSEALHDADDASDYVAKALELFPELAAHPLIMKQQAHKKE